MPSDDDYNELLSKYSLLKKDFESITVERDTLKAAVPKFEDDLNKANDNIRSLQKLIADNLISRSNDSVTAGSKDATSKTFYDVIDEFVVKPGI